MPELSPEATNLIACFDSLDALCSDLDAEQWATPSLCPGWSVRDALEHLTAVEAMFIGVEPGAWTESVPFDQIGTFIETSKDLDGPGMLASFREVAATRTEEVHSLTPEQLELPTMTPVGPSSYGHFLAVRVFDMWVHEQDMRRPLGLPGHESGAAAQMAMDETHKSLPYIVGKKIGLPDGKSIRFDLTGAEPRSMSAVVEGRARLSDHIDEPDVVITADSTVFALLACGRIEPQAEIDAGTITWSGDDEWGEKAAKNLRYTM